MLLSKMKGYFTYRFNHRANSFPALTTNKILDYDSAYPVSPWSRFAEKVMLKRKTRDLAV